jgi:hypothetical protein
LLSALGRVSEIRDRDFDLLNRGRVDVDEDLGLAQTRKKTHEDNRDEEANYS